ncbi:hypothetical protein Pcinc_022452 [Petrolisthes cinctipes]|uniref:Uncharacterized protein n=1 Tax=Petrolisthes cinctipes TaxID=88211 RepID=A0AAE1FEK1_PETCI|nr:hypothetical protein Pcinc_022452 [Petrolisthes cinctipes]
MLSVGGASRSEGREGCPSFHHWGKAGKRTGGPGGREVIYHQTSERFGAHVRFMFPLVWWETVARLRTVCGRPGVVVACGGVVHVGCLYLTPAASLPGGMWWGKKN